MTFGQKDPKLNSRLVYSSRLYRHCGGFFLYLQIFYTLYDAPALVGQPLWMQFVWFFSSRLKSRLFGFLLEHGINLLLVERYVENQNFFHTFVQQLGLLYQIQKLLLRYLSGSAQWLTSNMLHLCGH